jgi:hypothetical protein
MKWVGRWLEALGYFLFGATRLICLYEVTADCPSVPKLTEFWKDAFHKLTIVLPAFGAPRCSAFAGRGF